MKDIFNNISKENKELLLKRFEALTFKIARGESIKTKIGFNKIFGYIEDGELEIINKESVNNKIIMDVLSVGDIFSSKFTFISDKEDLIATCDTTLIIFDELAMKNYIYEKDEAYAQFFENLYVKAIEYIKVRNQRITILTNGSIRNKLLTYFDIEAKKTGSKKVYLPFSMTSLAAYLGVDRCAMSREIKNLKDEGFISVNKGKITLLYK